MRRRSAWTALGVLLVTTAALPASADPTQLTTAADIARTVAATAQAMKPGQGFAWQPLLRADGAVAAIEIWKSPASPAVHPAEGEYATVLEGTGTLVAGGTLVDGKATQPGLVEGSRIDGGTTRSLHPGDVFLIPAGTPHWFGITGDRLVLLGIKVPRTGQ